MKKVLSVLLAAAMVMGMSVASFATTYGVAEKVEKPIDDANGNDRVKFANVYQLRDNEWINTKGADTAEDLSLKAGDVLYFTFWYTESGKDSIPTFDPSNWTVKINNADYVDGASLYNLDSTTKAGKALKALGNQENQLMVKVVLEDDFDHFEEEVEFYFYMYDGKYSDESPRVHVAYDFADYATKTLTEDDLDWVLTVDGATTYTYKKGEKAAYATIDFDGNAYGEFKMYPGEKYTLSSTIKYNKDLSKEYDTDVEVVEFRLKNVDNIDLVFESAKDNKQVVAVVDGELVPVEATYVEDHKFASGDKVDGYLVENAEYTAYALIDADVEIEVEAEEEVEAPVEADKANPETGAADFVGAAVAMAVVSVAAAGALALKK